MPVKKEEKKAFFRPLIGNAVAHAWYHRELWPLAAIAGLAGMGAAINDVLTQARLSSALPDADPLTFLTSISFLRDIIKNVVSQTPQAIIITLAIVLLILFIAALLLSWCQHIILRASHHASTSKAPLSLHELAKDAAHPRILRILVIDAFIKVLILNAVILSGMLLAQLHPLTSFFDAFFGIIFSAGVLLCAFFCNVWGMLALIHVVKKDISLVHAFGMSWRMMKTHAVACLELSLLLFAVTFAIALIAIVGLIVIGSLSIPFFSVVIAQGTLFGITLVTFCTILLGTVWAVASAGFSTLVTYLSWTSLTESLELLKKNASSRGWVHAKRSAKHLFG